MKVSTEKKNEIRVEINESMYPRLSKILDIIPKRLRAEKIRQLASIGEMAESGLIDTLGNQLLAKINLASIQINHNTSLIKDEIEEIDLIKKLPISPENMAGVSMSE